jgi:hypothetical protein
MTAGEVETPPPDPYHGTIDGLAQAVDMDQELAWPMA